MSVPATVDIASIQEWFSAKLDHAAVTQHLQTRGLDDEAIALHLTAYRKFQTEKRQFRGFCLMAAGAFLGFLSCVLTLVNPIPELYNVILYGLTMFAILVIVCGLYCVVE